MRGKGAALAALQLVRGWSLRVDRSGHCVFSVMVRATQLHHLPNRLDCCYHGIGVQLHARRARMEGLDLPRWQVPGDARAAVVGRNDVGLRDRQALRLRAAKR